MRIRWVIGNCQCLPLVIARFVTTALSGGQGFAALRHMRVAEAGEKSGGGEWGASASLLRIAVGAAAAAGPFKLCAMCMSFDPLLSFLSAVNVCEPPPLLALALPIPDSPFGISDSPFCMPKSALTAPWEAPMPLGVFPWFVWFGLRIREGFLFSLGLHRHIKICDANHMGAAVILVLLIFLIFLIFLIILFILFILLILFLNIFLFFLGGLGD